MVLLGAGALAAAAEAPTLEPIAEPGPAAIANTDEAPEITIRKRGRDRVEEYRMRGQLYMVKVTPRIGKPTNLVHTRGAVASCVATALTRADRADLGTQDLVRRARAGRARSLTSRRTRRVADLCGGTTGPPGFQTRPALPPIRHPHCRRPDRRRAG